MAELVDGALKSIGNNPIISGKHRDRKPIDPVLRLAWDLRQEKVAHRVKMTGAAGPAWQRFSQQYKAVWPFLFQLLELFSEHLATIRQSGLLDRPDLNAARRIYKDFSADDVAALIRAANALPVSNGAA